MIDARGMVVAPRLHQCAYPFDYTLVADDDAQSLVRQGVTSMIFGEGESAAPVRGRQQEKPKDVTWRHLGRAI